MNPDFSTQSTQEDIDDFIFAEEEIHISSR